jgi:gluconokinase
LRDGVPDARFVYLRATPATIARRLATRRGHFMPAALLESQLETLEEPDASEPAVALDAEGDPGAIVRAIRDALGV